MVKVVLQSFWCVNIGFFLKYFPFFLKHFDFKRLDFLLGLPAVQTSVTWTQVLILSALALVSVFDPDVTQEVAAGGSVLSGQSERSASQQPPTQFSQDIQSDIFCSGFSSKDQEDRRGQDIRLFGNFFHMRSCIEKYENFSHNMFGFVWGLRLYLTILDIWIIIIMLHNSH